jgi:hypothetical protein
MEWEIISWHNTSGTASRARTERLAVPGGWIYCDHAYDGTPLSTTYVPDPAQWQGTLPGIPTPVMPR